MKTDVVLAPLVMIDMGVLTYHCVEYSMTISYLRKFHLCELRH